MTRRLIVSISLVALLAAFPWPAAAAENGTISASVTVAAPCVTTGAPINYGTLGLAPNGATPAPAPGSSSYTNCSSEVEQIAATGSDATSTTAGSTALWTLQSQQPCIGTTTLNQYRVEAKDYAQLSLALSSSTASPLHPGLAPGTTEPLTTFLYMPCSGSSGVGETMQFTITVIAYF